MRIKESKNQIIKIKVVIVFSTIIIIIILSIIIVIIIINIEKKQTQKIYRVYIIN